ncbi:MAG: O-antigen ligase family protein, partial [Pseudomonadales bacterium]|nr:O-antigen ligase family protein [Pseudomonadales bacterium]
SGVYSIWRSNSLTFVVNGLLVITLVFALIFKVVRSWTIARALIFTLCASGALLGAAAILGYHGARAEAGVTYDTNDLAYLLVTTLPLAVALAIDGTGWRRWLFGSMAGAMIVATLLTESRGGLLGLFAGLLAVLWLRPTAVNAKTGAMGRISKTLVWAVIATLIGVASWPLLPASARERFASLLNIESDYNVQEEDVGRTFSWRRNLKAVAKRPIGYGVASSSALDLRLGGRFKTAHNSVVQIATELGVLGAFLFLRLYWLAWRQLSAQSARMRERATASTERIARSDVPVILYALRASLVASFVAGFFLSQGYSYLLYTLLGLIAAVALLDSNAGVTSSTPVASKWTRQRR